MRRKGGMQKQTANKKRKSSRKCGKTAIEQNAREQTAISVPMELIQMELLRASARR